MLAGLEREARRVVARGVLRSEKTIWAPEAWRRVRRAAPMPEAPPGGLEWGS